MGVPVYVELSNEQMDFLVRLMGSKKAMLTADIGSGALSGEGIQQAGETVRMMSDIIRSFTVGIKMTTEIIEEMTGGK